MVAQCGRVFGSVPTYYIFDGREEQRAISCLNAEANSSGFIILSVSFYIFLVSLDIPGHYL